MKAAQGIQLGLNYHRAGRLAEAEQVYRQVLSFDPNNVDALNLLGTIAGQTGKFEIALGLIDQVLSIQPNFAEAWNNRGNALRALRRHQEALASYDRAIAARPNYAEAFYNRGNALLTLKLPLEALAGYDQALSIQPQWAEALHNRGLALHELLRHEEALASYDKALAVRPDYPEVLNSRGITQLEMGNLKEARSDFERAIAQRPDFFEAHYNLSRLVTYSPENPQLALLERWYGTRTGLPDHERIYYSFALGKALEDIGEYDRSFAAYEEGNRLQRALLPLDERQADELVERVLAVCNERFFAERGSWEGARLPTRTPVFIVGMPRSGTTLLEQILSSHASVHGAGELPDLEDAYLAMTGGDLQHPFPDGMAALSEADFRRLGLEYMDRVWQRSPESAFIINKSPKNYLYLGLIHLALPNARIIHVTRDPMDACFSCYSLRFTEDEMLYAYDQETLGRHFLRYVKLVEHWRGVLPPGSILDVPYEALVEDTEGQAKRVLEFLGLPWDDNCLAFHNKTGPIKTASAVQVRKPIYSSSVARWRHFGRHLIPLLRMVSAHRPMTPEDLALLEGHP